MSGHSGEEKLTNSQRSTSLFEDRTLFEKGLAAEDVALDFLNSRPAITQIDDVRNVQEWQQKEVDFRITIAQREKMLIEVKSDKWLGKSGNVLFEYGRIHHTAKPEHCARLGWSVFSKADAFLIWSTHAEALHIFDSGDFRRAMQNYVGDFRGQIRTCVVPTDSRRTTINILVPIIYMPYKVYVKNGKGWVKVGEYVAAKAA